MVGEGWNSEHSQEGSRSFYKATVFQRVRLSELELDGLGQASFMNPHIPKPLRILDTRAVVLMWGGNTAQRRKVQIKPRGPGSMHGGMGRNRASCGGDGLGGLRIDHPIFLVTM